MGRNHWLRGSIFRLKTIEAERGSGDIWFVFQKKNFGISVFSNIFGTFTETGCVLATKEASMNSEESIDHIHEPQ